MFSDPAGLAVAIGRPARLRSTLDATARYAIRNDRTDATDNATGTDADATRQRRRLTQYDRNPSLRDATDEMGTQPTRHNRGDVFSFTYATPTRTLYLQHTTDELLATHARYSLQSGETLTEVP
jgi:hypothetical protein